MTPLLTALGVLVMFATVGVNSQGICGDILRVAEVTTDIYTKDTVPPGYTLCYLDDRDVAYRTSRCDGLISNVAYGAFKDSTELLAANGIFGCWFGNTAVKRGPAYTNNRMIKGACTNGNIQHHRALSSWTHPATVGVCIRIPETDCINPANNDCSEHANCIPLGPVGAGYNCVCKDGFVDNDSGNPGRNCSDFDECGVTDTCNVNAQCTNTIGVYNCTCNNGYQGDGFNCTDFDECGMTDTCNVNAQCTNTIGGYNCTCNNGYQGDGFTCTDFDECGVTDTCDVNAQCTNTIGGYNCTCNNGYQGDGFTCTDFDECGVTDTCDVNAQCTNTIGGYNCTCNNGYQGDGFTCTDVDECLQSSSNDCNANATCRNSIGNFTCECNNGFRGDGKVCKDVRILESAVSVICRETQVTGVIDPAKLKNMTIMELTIDGCASSDFNVTGNAITTTYDKCAKNVTQDNNIINLETDLVVRVCETDSSNTICRGSYFTYTMGCRLDRRLNVTTVEGVNVSMKESYYFEKKSKTNITAAMMFYTSNLFDTIAPSPLLVTSFEPLYISVKALEAQSLFKIIVEDCYATPSPNPLDSKKYLFFSDKCGVDTTLKVYSQHSSDSKFSYKINAFQFIQVKTRVFFHCRVLICTKTTSTELCTQKCAVNKRKRRAIGEDTLDELYVNSGPVVFQRKRTCETTDCPSKSRCYDLYPAKCRCNQGYIMDIVTKTCNTTEDQALTVTNIHIERPFLPSYGSTTTDDFIRLSIHVEHKMMTAYAVDTKFIRGIKVLNARKGSVNLDIIILYPSNVTTMDVFKHFMEAVIEKDKTSPGLLGMNRHLTPELVVRAFNDVEKGTALSEELMTVAIVFSAVAVIGFALVVILVLRRRAPAVTKPTAYDNKAIELDNTS